MKTLYKIGLTALLLAYPLVGTNNPRFRYLEKKIPLEIKKEEPIKQEFSMEKDYTKFIQAIINQESKGNHLAYNKNSKSTGLMQITPIALQEWNNFNNEKYTMNDLFNKEINQKVGEWILNRLMNYYIPHYKLENSLENILTAYNWGIKGLKKVKNAKTNFNKLPKETKDYITKIKEDLVIE